MMYVRNTITKDPIIVYPKVPGIDYNKFKLSEEKKTREKMGNALAELSNYISGQQKNFLGYQVKLTKN